MKDLFDEVGISESQLQDKETANFIYDFIQQRGGVEAVKQERAKASVRAQGALGPPSVTNGTARLDVAGILGSDTLG